MLPTEAFGMGAFSCWRRISEWTGAGIWPQVQRRLLNCLVTLGDVVERTLP